MTIPEKAVLLRIFLGEDDRHGHQPLYEAIILNAREQGLAGATRCAGRWPWPRQSPAHHQDPASVPGPAAGNRNVDSREKIDAFLPFSTA